jgi:hypothetical protein
MNRRMQRPQFLLLYGQRRRTARLRHFQIKPLLSPVLCWKAAARGPGQIPCNLPAGFPLYGMEASSLPANGAAE